MNHLALQIGEVNNIEIDNAERSDAGRSQIERQRRAQTAGADAQHLGLLQLELPLHADFGHDEVPRVAQDLVVAEPSATAFCLPGSP